MIQITAKQYSVFTQENESNFKQKMHNHINTFFSDKYNELTEIGCQQLISSGIVCAKNYSIISECDVCKFIDLMVVFGAEFDKEPWAKKILTDKAGYFESSEKIDALYVMANEIEHDNNN